MAVPEKIEKSKVLEDRERLEKEEAAKLAKLSEGAEKAGEKKDKDTDAIFRIEAKLKPEEQKDELETLQAHLIVLVTDLKKVGADVSILKENPRSLENLIGTYHPKLNEEKEAARGKLGNLLMEEGPTSSYVKSSQFWIETVGETDSIINKPIEKYKEWYEKDKLLTAGVTAGVALGLGIFVGKLLFSKKTETPSPTPKKKGWKKTKIALAVGVGALAIYLGKDKAMELLGGLMKDKTLETLGFDAETIKDIESAAKHGTELSEKTRELLSKSEQGREVLSKIEAGEQENGVEKPLEKSDEVKENVEKITLSEAAQAHRYLITVQALMGLYELDAGSNEKLSQEMTAAFDAFSHHNVKTTKIVEVYQKAKVSGKTEIKAENLGLEDSSDVSPEGFYHAAAIVNKAYEYHQKRFPETINSETTVKEFLIILGNDPALSVANRVQKSMEERLKDLNISSLPDLLDNAEKIFESEAIDGAIDQHKEQFIEHFNQKYGIETSDLNPPEKISFFKTIGILYSGLEGDQKLDSSIDRIRIAVKERSDSEVVTQKVIQFWKKLKEETKPIFEASVKRYDIKRPDNTKYDSVLYNNLKFENLDFKDGLQLALLSDGINFEQKTEGEGLGQTKEISMVFLMASLLKKHNPEAHALYMINLITSSTDGAADIKLNPHFEKISPYFKKLFGALVKKGWEWTKKISGSLDGFRNLNDDPNKIAKLEKMDFLEFSLKGIESGVKGGFQISKELVLTLYENFPDLLQVPTSGEDILQMIMAAGGLIFYSKVDGENTGLIYLGGNYFVWKPIEIGVDTLSALTSGPGVAMKSYLIGTAPFVALGAAGGFARGAMLKHAGVISSTLKGGLRMVAAPISVPLAGWRAGRGVFRYAELTSNWWKYGSGNIENLEMTARLFEEYSQKATSESSTFSNRLKLIKNKKGLYPKAEETFYQTKRWIYSDLYEKARVRWGKKFVIEYNNFFGLDADSRNNPIEPLLPRAATDMNSGILRKAKTMRLLVKELKTWPDLETLEKDIFLERIEKLKTPLSPEEIEALKNRANHNFEELKQAISRKVKGNKNLPGVEKPTFQSPTDKLTTPEKLRNGKYRYMGETYSLNSAEQNLVDMKPTPEAQAAELKNILAERWAIPEFVSKGPAGDLYKYRGGTFVISDVELSTHGSLEAAMEAKYIESIKITDTRTFEGRQEFKINNEWIRPAEGPDAELRARKSFAEAAKAAGISIDHMDLSNTKVLKYWPIFKQMMGPGMAIGAIVHLETAPDKKKALVETGVGLATFMGAERVTRQALDKFIVSKDPRVLVGKEVVALLVGLGAAMELTQPLSEIFEEIIPQFTGDNETFGELASIGKAIAFKQLVTSEALKTGGKKLLSLSKVATMRVRDTLGKKLAQFTSTSTMKRLGASLGLRGSVLAGVTATPIPFDDIVTWGIMAPWIAKDTYDIIVLRNKCAKMEAFMDQHKDALPHVEPGGEGAEKEINQKALEAALIKAEKPLDKMDQAELKGFLASIPDIRLRFTYPGSTGYEEHRFLRGEIHTSRIQTESGEILELSDEEMNREIALPPPQEFDPSKVNINYEAPKEQLEANYRLAILYTKSECGWTKLDHEIVDNKTIIIKRLDGPQQTKINRSEDKWSVEGYSEGNDLFQALVLANLKNKVQGTMEKEGYTGGSSRPFSIDGGNIDFDKSWNPNDLRVLSEDTGWLAFYDKIGLNQRIIVDMLNNWYQKEGKSLAVAA